MTAIITLIILLLVQQSTRTYKLSLFFSNHLFTQLKHENRSVLKSSALEEKIRLCLLLLIYGPVKETLKATIPEKTKIEMIHYEKGLASISFSEEFQSSIAIHDSRIVVYSTLLSLFISFPELEKIKLYIKHRQLRTILGQYNYNQIFDRTAFLEQAKIFVPSLN